MTQVETNQMMETGSADPASGIRVLMVTREGGLDRRYGLGKSLVPVVEELRRRGVEVGYLTQADAGERGIRALRAFHAQLNRFVGRLFSQTDFYSLSWGVLERLNMGRLAAKVAAAQGYTHIHCHDPIIAEGYRWHTRLNLTRGKRRRHGITQHGFGSYVQAFHEDGAVLGPGVMRWLRHRERRALERADWVLVPAHADAEQLARDLGQYPIPAHWHAIPHPRPRLSRHDKDAARARLGWRPDLIYVIAVGRFAPLKRLPTLIEACARLPCGDWRLVLIGDGDREPLRALAQSLGIGDRVAFEVTDDMGLYYSAADIYASTSTTESFGLANLEALLAGLPAVCTAVGATPEVLGSGAWLIPRESPPALTAALRALIEDADLRAFWSDRARAWTAAWPDADAIAGAYLALYRGERLAPMEPGTATTLTAAPFAAWQAEAARWPICPLPRPLEIPADGGSVLVLAPHHDDETLGCGGTLALLRAAGWRVKVVVVTDGARGDPSGFIEGDVSAHRQRETRAALAQLGIDDLEFLDQPDGDLVPTPALTERIGGILDASMPDWWLIPPPLDFHRDHVNTSLLAVDLWQSRGYRERLFFYELWQPLPVNRVVDVTGVVEIKRRAMAAYELPLRYGDYSQAFDGLMRYRGFYLEGHAGKQAEALLELRPSAWRAVVSSLMRLRISQASELS